jgi:hypothetical protein
VGAGLDELQNFPVNGELDGEAIDPDYLVADLQPESAKSQKGVSLIPLARVGCGWQSQSDTYLETLEEGVGVDFDVRHKKAGAVLAAASDAEPKPVGRRPSLELDISGLVGRVWHQKIVLHLLIQWHDAPVNTETHTSILYSIWMNKLLTFRKFRYWDNI